MASEEEQNDAINRKEKEQIKKEHLHSVNARQYHKSNEKKTDSQKTVIRGADGSTKTKTVELTTYKNGVVKSRLKSVFKQ